jgi:hypothetical protein
MSGGREVLLGLWRQKTVLNLTPNTGQKVNVIDMVIQ